MKETPVDFSIDGADLAKLKRFKLELKESISNFKVVSWNGVSMIDKLSKTMKNIRNEVFEAESTRRVVLSGGTKFEPKIISEKKIGELAPEPESRHHFFKTLFGLNGRSADYCLAVFGGNGENSSLQKTGRPDRAKH